MTKNKTHPARFLAIPNPIDAIKDIKHPEQVTKELWEILDNQKNLDAQIYIFFTIIIQDKQFVIHHLGKRKWLADLSMEDLYTLAKGFKERITLEKSGVQFPISSYGMSLYKQRYDTRKNGQPNQQKPIQLYQSLDGKVPATNTLLHHHFDISQTIDGRSLVDIVEKFYGCMDKVIEALNRFSSQYELEQYVKKNNNLNHFIQSQLRSKKQWYETQVVIFFTQMHNLYNSLKSMHSIANSKRWYNTIKHSLTTSFKQHWLEVRFLDAATKTPERSFTKLLKKYKGKVFELKDIARCSFAFPDLNSVVQWINLLLQTLHQDNIYPLIKQDNNEYPSVEFEDKIGLLLTPAQKWSGYRDISFVIHFRWQTGLVPMEIQFHLEDTLAAKKQGTSNAYSTIKQYFSDKQIEHINGLLQEKESKLYLPTSDHDIVSADHLYHIRRHFGEDIRTSVSTGQKIFSTIISPIKNLLFESLSDEEIAKKLADIERHLHDSARKQVLLRLHLFDELGNHHPIKKYLNNLNKK